MARVKSINRATKDIMVVAGQPATFQVPGWHVEMDESVDWIAYCGTYGDIPVRFVFCKPYTTGPWEIITRQPAGKDPNPKTFRWHPDNEDWFFFPEYQNNQGQWIPVSGAEG